MLITRLQNDLQRHYDISVPYQITDFITHDNRLFKHASDQPEQNSETLFIRQYEEAIDISLYLDADILAQAEQTICNGAARGSHFNALGVVVEGVSHTLCLLWHAHYDRQLRPLDLELQAEIDKFLLIKQLLPQESGKLHKRLFSDIRFKTSVKPIVDRYRRANQYAAYYCHWLSTTFMHSDTIRHTTEQRLHTELARFYRLSGNDKVRYARARYQSTH
jgi:hypothetical protein